VSEATVAHFKFCEQRHETKLHLFAVSDEEVKFSKFDELHGKRLFETFVAQKNKQGKIVN